MSKLRCFCGHVIVDQTDALPYKAIFIADENDEEFSQSTLSAIEKIVIAWKQGKLSELFGEKFAEVYPKDSELRSFLNDVLAVGYSEYSRTIYECEWCGRIWLQSRDRDEEFFPYLPEKEERGILRSIRSNRESNQT